MAKVLVVDDDKDLLFALSEVIVDLGHQVETALNGQLGLDHLKEFSPDLILLDYNMPVMGGSEFIEHLRSNPLYHPYSAVPVISIGNFPEAPYWDKIAHFLRKPFDLAQLESCIQQYCG